MKPPEPPKHLSKDARSWWRKVTGEYQMEDHHLRLLRLACEAWDRGQAAREALAVNGLTFTDRFGTPKPRPEVAVERDSRIAYARLLRELALDVSAPDDSRPPALTAGRGKR